jgi:probable F420-dependent oxidoreductase
VSDSEVDERRDAAPSDARPVVDDSLPQLSTTLVTFAADDPGSWDRTLEWARALDLGGVDRLVVSDHVVFGEDLDAYGRVEVSGAVGGAQPTGPDGHWLEPLTTLSVIAGMTSRIRLGTNILIAALRRPAVLAKATATLDVLSHGRLDLGVGLGWQREEYEAAGLDFGRRGHLLDHTLAVCRTLWTERRASFESSDLRFDAIHMMPKPTRPPGVPIWVAGTVTARTAGRVAEYGTGWIPWGADADDIGAGIGRMRRALTEAGHDPAGLQVVGTLSPVRRDGRGIDVPRTMERVPMLVEAGVTDVRLRISMPTDPRDDVDRVTEIVQAFRRTTGRAGT